MEALLIAGFALTLGIVLGVSVGYLRGWNAQRQRAAMEGMSAGMAALWPTTLPQRSAPDIIAGVIRLHLGGKEFTLPVLPRAAEAAWLAGLDARFAHLTQQLDEAADDTPRILMLLGAQTDDLLAALYEYDESNVLPERVWVDTYATNAQVLVAIMEVWRAAHPLAATLLEAAESETGGTASEPSSTQPTPMVGPQQMSPG